MKHLATLIWAILLLQMVNFVLNSLNGGGSLNVIAPLVMAVIFTIVVAILSAVIKPTKQSSHNHQ